MNDILEKINGFFPLSPVDVGDNAKMKVSGMNFTLSCFDAKGLGRVSFMQATGMMGLMKMDTLVVNPFEKDAPLLSYDRIFALGNDTCYTELYNTCLGDSFGTVELNQIHASAKDLPTVDPGTHWYDHIKMPQSTYLKGKKAQREAFDTFVDSFLVAYLKASSEAQICDAKAKKEKAGEYTEGLLEHGGPACDVWKKSRGLEFTQDFFRRLLFGTGK